MACPGLATSIFANSLGSETIILSDNDDIKKRYLPLTSRGEKNISFATSESAIEVANEARQIFGGYGYTHMYPVEKTLS